MSSAPPQILVVDDCRINLLLLRHILGKMPVRVDTAGDGERAVELASTGHYPLIFLDIMLPGIDGFEVSRRLRAQPLVPRPRIVLLTAMGEKFPRSRAAEVGADDVLFKPIVPSQILEITRATLGQAEVRVHSEEKTV